MLCVAMMLSVMVMSTGATSFTDEDKVSDNYAEAVEVLTGMGVIKGDDNNAFRPQDSITRAEVSTLIYRAATADVGNTHPGLTAGANLFTDVSEDDWFAGYVNYCADAEYVKGYEDNTFRAANDVTGYEVLAMILRAVGYDKNNEFTGLSWTIQVASTATKLGMLKNLDDSVSLAAPATREVVAELIFQAIVPGVETVHYSPAAGTYREEGSSLGEQVFDLAVDYHTNDIWGRPSTTWYQDNTRFDRDFNEDKDVAYAVIEEEALATFNVAISECDVATALDVDKTTHVAYWDNGVVANKDYEINPTETEDNIGAQGTLIEVYADRFIQIDTYLAVVDDVNEATYDDAGHEKTPASSDIRVWMVKDVQPKEGAISSTAYDEGAYILVNYNQGTEKFYDVQEADAFVGAQTRIWWNASQHTINGETYDDAAHFALDKAGRTQTENFTWFLDQYGNVIGNVELDRTGYAVLKDIIWNVGTPGYAEATLVYMDGTEDTVTVNTFDGLENDFEANDWPYRGGNGWDTEDPAEPTLSDSSSAFPGVSSDTKYNAIYEGYALYVVTTNDDGTVNLDQATEQGGEVFYDYRATLDTNSSAIILDNDTRLTVTANTEFLVRNSDNTYSACTRADLPELAQNTEIFYTTTADDNGVAECVYVKNGVNEAELGSHLFVITDNYSRIAGKPNTFEMVVNVDGVERTIATNEANVKYLAANEGKLFHVTWELNPYAGFYGFVDELRLVNDKKDNEPTCDYMSTVTYKGDTLYNANNSYTVDADTVIVGNNGVIDDSKGIWVLCDDNKTTHADVVFVGTKLDPSVALTVTAAKDEGTITVDPTDATKITFNSVKDVDKATLTYTANDANSVIVYAGNKTALYTVDVDVNAKATQRTVTVWNEAGTNAETYTITLTWNVKSSDASLDSVTVDGTEVTIPTGRTDPKMDSAVNLGSETAFTMNVVASSDLAKVEIGSGDTLDNAVKNLSEREEISVTESTALNGGYIVIKVTAEDGTVLHYVYNTAPVTVEEP